MATRSSSASTILCLWVTVGVTATNRARQRERHARSGHHWRRDDLLAGTNRFDSVDIADANTAYNGIAGVAGTTVAIPAEALLSTDGTTPGAFGAGVRYAMVPPQCRRHTHLHKQYGRIYGGAYSTPSTSIRAQS
jgi:hypothetical protein